MKTSVHVPSLLAILMASPDAKAVAWIGHGVISENTGNYTIGSFKIEKSVINIKYYCVSL